MNSFSISDLERYSGIKAHTIRMWELRYKALDPHRTEGNTRFYDDLQLKRLLNIVSLLPTDHRVSELCSMSDEELKLLLEVQLDKVSHSYKDNGYYVAQLIAAGIDFNEAAFEKIFSNCILKSGLLNTYADVLYPALVRMGLLWAMGKLPPAKEHFLSNLMRQKMISAIDSMEHRSIHAETWMLFLPEDEGHELGLLMAHFILRHSGRNVIYLGAFTPLSTIAEAVDQTGPSHLLTFLIKRKSESDALFVEALTEQFHDRKVFVACHPSTKNIMPNSGNLGLLHSIHDLENNLM